MSRFEETTMPNNQSPKHFGKRILKQLALASLLAAATVAAQTPYDEGQKALREQRWMEAAGQFNQVIEDDREQADAARYWRAYAFYKAGRGNEAERELRRLERDFPDSRWVKEGQALLIEHQGSGESIEQMAAGGAELDDDLRLFALAQLMERDPERALPLVLDLVHSSDSPDIRRDALFVLGISEEPAALKALVEIAGESDDPELQMGAIHILGALDTTSELRSLYPTLNNRDTQVAAIEAFSIAGDIEMLTRILESETDPQLRSAALSGIAMEGGDDAAKFIESSYATAQSREEKAAILRALTMMDEATELALKILRTETDPDLQKQAIQVLGIMDATEELGNLYGSLDSRESRKAVLEAMSIADDTDGLFRVLQSEQDEELRFAAIQGLAISGEQEASDYLVELYPRGSRKEKSAVIQSMMIMDNSQGLLVLLKQESDPELKREMLQMLTLMDSEESDEYLFEMLENKG